jgi:hypothetical protein
MFIKRQSAPEGRDETETRPRHRIGTDRIEGRHTMVNKLTGAIARALIVVALISTPAILLPATPPDTALIVAIAAIVAAVFTFLEYSAQSPSLVEFRDAPPFNRIRFFALLTTVFVLTLILRDGTDPSTITRLFTVIGIELSASIDFPYSPVRMIVLMMPEQTNPALIESVRTAAGLSYLISIVALGTFVLYLRVRGWPSRSGSFNVWINLPTFDPTLGGDVVERLRRDSQLNLILGFLLPFIIPAFVKLASDVMDPVNLANPHTLIWTMTAWAFLPASLLMRGIALNKVADMIDLQRRQTFASEAPLAAA